MTPTNRSADDKTGLAAMGTHATVAAKEREQERVRSWFDAVYERRGVRYLRPATAYPIYMQLLGVQPGEALLDVGCGPGLLLEAALRRDLHASGVDLSSTAIELAKARVPGATVCVGNAEALDFEAARFDYVTCIGSLERMLDRRQVLAEMQRVAKPEARFCFLVRNCEHATWRVWHRALGRRNRSAHQDALTLDAWRDLFETSGFEIERVLPDQWPRQRLRRALGLGPRDGRDERVHVGRLPLRWA
ncbi:MAG TPA: methyltransferase domain-containing protein, partial [Planctomycetota bacterium]|nr:methyltransferase domain-containing protein [Planctomycetota bacterium]